MQDSNPPNLDLANPVWEVMGLNLARDSDFLFNIEI